MMRHTLQTPEQQAAPDTRGPRLRLEEVWDADSGRRALQALQALPATSDGDTTILVEVPPVDDVPAVWLRCLLYIQQAMPRRATLVVGDCPEAFRLAAKRAALTITVQGRQEAT